MRLVVVPSGVDGAGWYRLLFPARELGLRGWSWWMAPYVAQRLAGGKGSPKLMLHYGQWEQAEGGVKLVEDLWGWLERAEYDVLLLQQREEPGWPELIERLQAQGKRVYVDSDDAWFGLPAWNPGAKKTKAARDAMCELLAAADGLSVATPALAEMYAPYQSNIRVIRNRLDWGMWADITPVYERPTRRLRVGWMGHSHWRKGDLEVLRGVLGPWLEQHPDIEFVAAGDPSAHDVLCVPPEQRVSVAEVEFQNKDLADITATFDIGLIPLDLSAAGRSLNECKSHLKGLEYNAAGIPWIASPSESYRWYLDNGGCGLLAANPKQWRDSLNLLIEQPWVRDAMAVKGRFTAKDLSIQNGGADEWANWLGSGTHSDTPVALLAA